MKNSLLEKEHMMKKKIIALTLISGLAVASIASANWGRGNGWQGNQMNDCPRLGLSAQVNPEQKEKVDKFVLETQELRKSIAVKQAEKMAILRGENPDPAAVSKLTGELFDLRTEMRNLAEEAGVAALMGPQNGRFFQRGQGKGLGGRDGRGQGNGRGRGPGGGQGPNMMNNQYRY